MVTRVVRVRARAVVGDTVMVHGRPAVVVELLTRERGQLHTARVTHDPPCRACERRLLQRFLAVAKQKTDSTHAGEAHDRRDVRASQVARGALGAAPACRTLRTMAAHQPCLYLPDTVTGPGRRALAWY